LLYVSCYLTSLQSANFSLDKMVSVSDYNKLLSNLSVDSYGNTILMKAIENNDINGVKYLIKNGANINHQLKCGSTALMVAAVNGNLSIVKYLVKNGADVNLGHPNGYNALTESIIESHMHIYHYLIKFTSNRVTMSSGEIIE
jgi:ankyrin repeat protein